MPFGSGHRRYYGQKPIFAYILHFDMPSRSLHRMTVASQVPVDYHDAIGFGHSLIVLPVSAAATCRCSSAQPSVAAIPASHGIRHVTVNSHQNTHFSPYADIRLFHSISMMISRISARYFTVPYFQCQQSAMSASRAGARHRFDASRRLYENHEA